LNAHALENQHYMYINLSNQKVYCLPDDYEVEDKSLDDIKYNLDPTYNPESIKTMDEYYKSRGLDGTVYFPGYIGFNNLGNTDYANVILQSL